MYTADLHVGNQNAPKQEHRLMGSSFALTIIMMMITMITVKNVQVVEVGRSRQAVARWAVSAHQSATNLSSQKQKG